MFLVVQMNLQTAHVEIEYVSDAKFKKCTFICDGNK